MARQRLAQLTISKIFSVLAVNKIKIVNGRKLWGRTENAVNKLIIQFLAKVQIPEKLFFELLEKSLNLTNPN